ncbi:MAG: hypothetical protein ACO4CG_05040 [Prochlorothrix sp.]|nr:hypothetical protein [Prochlorothrix sp.]
MSFLLWTSLAITIVTLALVPMPPRPKAGLETILQGTLEFDSLLFTTVAFCLRAAMQPVWWLIDRSGQLWHLLQQITALVWINWYRPNTWLRGIQTVFRRKNHLVETAGIYFSISNLFYLCLFLRPDLIGVALTRSVLNLSWDPLLVLVSGDLTPVGVLRFGLGLLGVCLFFYHTYFVDIFYGRFHDPIAKTTSLEVALPNRGYTVLGDQAFHCFEQEVRLARSGHTTFGGPRAAMFSFAMAVLSGRLQGKVRSPLVPAAFFEYLTNHSPALRDVGYAVRSVLDPVLNPVGFSNLIALVAACCVAASEALAILTLPGDVGYAHYGAFSAGLFIVLKKVGWIIATVHGRVSLVFRAQTIRSLFVEKPQPPHWRRAVVQSARSIATLWPWLGTASQRLAQDIWNAMGHLYAILGWFSLVVIESEFVKSAWEQIQEPLRAQPLETLWGWDIAPLVAILAYTLLHNPEAPYRIGMAIFNLPAFWCYTKLADHHITLPDNPIAPDAPTITQVEWLLQDDWQWFWDELLKGCRGSEQKYVRLQGAIADPVQLAQTCKYLNVPTADTQPIELVRLAFRPIEPRGWFAFFQSQESQQVYTEKAQQVIAGYVQQLDAIDPHPEPEAA